MHRELVAARLRHESLRIKEGNLRKRLIFRDAVFDHGVGNQVRDTGCGSARAQEEDALVGQLFLLHAHGGIKARQHDGSRPLNVVVKAADLVAPIRKVREGHRVLEVLKLHEHVGPTGTHGGDEFFHERKVFVARHALLTEPQVEGIVQVAFGVGADVDRHGQRFLRIHAGAGRVKRELADGNPHAVHAQVAQPQNTGTVGDDDDVHVLVGDVRHEFCDVPLILGGHVEPPHVAVDVAVLLARFAHGRGVDERHEFFDVFNDEFVKELFVVGVHALQSEILVDRCRFRVDHFL